MEVSGYDQEMPQSHTTVQTNLRHHVEEPHNPQKDK